MQHRPSTTLCPICTRLSIIEPAPITVSCPDPRSIVVLAPISTSSPITTRPSCGTLIGAFGSGANPHPSCPIRAAGHHLDLSHQGPRRNRIVLVGLVADQERHPGQRSFDGLLVDEGGAGIGADERLEVFAVFEKTDVLRSRGLERRHVAKQPTCI